MLQDVLIPGSSHLKLDLNTEQSLAINLNLVYDKPHHLSGLIVSDDPVKALLMLSSGSLSVAVNKTLLHQSYDLMLQDLKKSRIITENEKDFGLQAKWQPDNLVINNQHISVVVGAGGADIAALSENLQELANRDLPEDETLMHMILGLFSSMSLSKQ